MYKKFKKVVKKNKKIKLEVRNFYIIIIIMFKKLVVFILWLGLLAIPRFAFVSADDYLVAAKDGFWLNSKLVTWIKWVTGTEKWEDKGDDLMKVIRNAINWWLWTLGLITFVLLLWAWFQMVTAAGDDKKFGEWLKVLKNAAIGLTFIAVSWLLVSMLFFVVTNVTKTESTPPPASNVWSK